MANNRLYLVDKNSFKYILLAKGWGSGWKLWNEETLMDRIKELIESSEELGETGKQVTNLTLETEYAHIDT